MTLSASEKAHIQSVWTKVSHQASALGAETLRRLYLSVPQAKNYIDYDTNGSKIFDAIGNATARVDDLDTDNMKKESKIVALLSHHTQVTLASHQPKDFTAEAYASWDKFLTAVYNTLDAQYK